ncbi:MAG: PD40 domain-containing protein, partial [Deltaproteobacteria bacterium]|nr:PD40 domain-containing protein [Deltaproteobacteria bacterium]
FKSEEGYDELNKKYPVQFNIYRIPFNNGKGGKAEPIPGASNNGKSNYCARYSPDGKWIVFTQSVTGLAVQPDSRLYIIPSAGGEARLMNCNLSRLNSWHTWSPNSRWLAFVSKENSAYTELFLTHIDENGNDSPPILVERFNKDNFAINVPEFIYIPAQSIKQIILHGN